jgi:hypothetical protein
LQQVGARKRSETRFGFKATIIEWRGPAPFFYAPVPVAQAAELRQLARVASYGWGCVPVAATVGGVTFTTSLFPKDDTYLLPLKVAVRRKANITVGDTIAVAMTVGAKLA